MSSYWLVSSGFAFVSLVPGAVLGPAFTAFAESSGPRTYDQILKEALLRSGEPRSTGREYSSAAGDFPWWIVLGMVGATLLYVRYQAQVLAALVGMSVAVFLASAVVVWIAWRRRVVAGTRARVACFIVPAILTTIGTLDAVFLWRGVGLPDGAKAVLAACSVDGLTNVNDLLPLVYSVLGVSFFALVAFLSIWSSLAGVAAMYVVDEVRPMWLWRAFIRNSAGAVSYVTMIGTVVLALVSMAICCGIVYRLIPIEGVVVV